MIIQINASQGIANQDQPLVGFTPKANCEFGGAVKLNGPGVADVAVVGVFLAALGVPKLNEEGAVGGAELPDDAPVPLVCPKLKESEGFVSFDLGGTREVGKPRTARPNKLPSCDEFFSISPWLFGGLLAIISCAVAWPSEACPLWPDVKPKALVDDEPNTGINVELDEVKVGLMVPGPAPFTFAPRAPSALLELKGTFFAGSLRGLNDRLLSEENAGGAIGLVSFASTACRVFGVRN